MKCLPDLVYDADNHLALDLYLPDGLQASACVIYAHGGGFKSGGRHHVEAVRFAKHFTDAGFALASVSYRLGTGPEAFSAQDRDQMERDGLRAQQIGLTLSPTFYSPAAMAAMEDLSKAVSFMWMEGQSIGIETPKVGILGVSAGGVAALMLAYPPAHWRDRVSRPDAVVALSSAFVQPWELDAEGPSCLLINGEYDRVIHLRNAQIGVMRAKHVGAPVALHITERPGHLSQIEEVLEGRTEQEEPYMQLVLDEFARLRDV